MKSNKRARNGGPAFELTAGALSKLTTGIFKNTNAQRPAQHKATGKEQAQARYAPGLLLSIDPKANAAAINPNATPHQPCHIMRQEGHSAPLLAEKPPAITPSAISDDSGSTRVSVVTLLVR